MFENDLVVFCRIAYCLDFFLYDSLSNVCIWEKNLMLDVWVEIGMRICHLGFAEALCFLKLRVSLLSIILDCPCLVC